MDDFSAYPEYRKARLPWLAEIPAHWEENRGKFYFREVDDRSKTGKEELLSVSHITGVTPRSQKNVSMFKAENYSGHKLCQPGDIIVNTMWAWMAALGVSNHCGIVSPSYGMYRRYNDCDFNSRYLDYLLRTQPYVSEYICRSTGIRSSRLRLYPDKFLDMPFIRPPRDEQDKIVAYLLAQDAHIARFIKAKRELIGLLNEQKQTLIHQAVTKGITPNAALKPSGIDWLKDIPEHWIVKPLKHWVHINKRTLPEGADPDFEFQYIDIGTVKTGRLIKKPQTMLFSKAPSRARRLLQKGDIIVSTVRTYLKAIWFVNVDSENLVASTGFAVFSSRKDVEPEYLGYVIQSDNFVDRVTANSIGIAYPAINESVLSRFKIAMPPTRDEQKRLIAKIKSETFPLEEAISRTTNEIELILEYRQRLITDAVTGQIDLRNWQPGPEDIFDDSALSALSEGDEPADEEDEDESD